MSNPNIASLEGGRQRGSGLVKIACGDVRWRKDFPSQLKGKALAVRRYDRAAACLRIHQEDLNQIFVQYPKDKYKKRNFSNVTAVFADQAGVAAGLDVVRRLTLNTIIGNGDSARDCQALIGSRG
jgi:hypothetical protein